MFVLSKRADSASQVIATLLAIAVVLWAVGTHHFAQAANLTFVSDTLSDSDTGALSNHTVEFTTPTGVTNGQSISIAFPNAFATNAVDFTDIDATGSTQGAFTVAGDCSAADEVSAAFASTTLTLTFCAGDGGLLAAAETITVLIGTNASGGDAQLTNPNTAVSYEISIAGTMADSGHTRVAITDEVLVTARVDTTFTFTVAGLATSTTVNGVSSTIAGTTTTIPFGTLTSGVEASVAQQLSVTSNAVNGFVVTVQQDQNLLSSTGADIDGFSNGAYTDTPTTWVSPTNTLGNEATYGHWGLTTNDSDLTGTPFGNDEFVSASTTPRLVFDHASSSDGTTQDVGQVEVLYQVEIASLQEAADDYNTRLTYIATPTF